jgi:hypothetical protein
MDGNGFSRDGPSLLIPQAIPFYPPAIPKGCNPNSSLFIPNFNEIFEKFKGVPADLELIFQQKLNKKHKTDKILKLIYEILFMEIGQNESP